MDARTAKFRLGQVVRHRVFPLRGVIYDVDPEFASSEERWLSIPEEIRPDRAQPYYHLLAENEQDCYIAYVSEGNLLLDESGEPVGHPGASAFFGGFMAGAYRLKSTALN